MNVLGPVEIIGDAMQWDWPLFLDLLGEGGLPENVLAWSTIDLAALDYDEDAALLDDPHHALLDAQLLCRFVSQGRKEQRRTVSG